MHLVIICVIVKYVKFGFDPKEVYPCIFACYEYFCTYNNIHFYKLYIQWLELIRFQRKFNLHDKMNT